MNIQITMLLALASLSLGSTSSAQQNKNVSSGLTGAGAPLAIHGYDPVAFFTQGQATMGSSKFTELNDGAAYRFSSTANQELFSANPGAYLPQFGGFCAFGVTVDQKFDGDPRVFEIVSGKLYFNLNPEIQGMWTKDVAANISKANKSWRALQSIPVKGMIAGDATNVSSSLTSASAPLAIHGYDAVAYFTESLPMRGSAKHTVVHGGAAYRFVSEANKLAFQKSPQRFLPQFGGFCAFGASVGKKFDGDPRVFEVLDGKLYFNLNPEIQALWSQDKAGNLEKASKQWSMIQTKSVGML